MTTRVEAITRTKTSTKTNGNGNGSADWVRRQYPNGLSPTANLLNGSAHPLRARIIGIEESLYLRALPLAEKHFRRTGFPITTTDYEAHVAKRPDIRLQLTEQDIAKLVEDALATKKPGLCCEVRNFLMRLQIHEQQRLRVGSNSLLDVSEETRLRAERALEELNSVIYGRTRRPRP